MSKFPLNNRPAVDVLAPPFTEAGAANILRLLECVRSIVGGLLSKGYTIRDGRLIPPESGEHVSSPIDEPATKDSTRD